MDPGSIFDNLHLVVEELMYGIGIPVVFAYANSFFSFSWDANGWGNNKHPLFHTQATHVQISTGEWYRIRY